MDIEQIATEITRMTIDYTRIFHESFPGKDLDKQQWAALHLGMMQAFLLCGYPKKKCYDALEIAQGKLARWSKELDL